MKKLANLKGVKTLNTKEQKNIEGGGFRKRCAGTSCYSQCNLTQCM